MKDTKLEISMLCDIYGSLLSEKQRESVTLYCDEDFSLSEIAENAGISRQGVRDQIKHAEAQLALYEEKLGLLEKYTSVSRLLSELAASDAVKADAALAGVVQNIRNILNLD